MWLKGTDIWVSFNDEWVALDSQPFVCTNLNLRYLLQKLTHVFKCPIGKRHSITLDDNNNLTLTLWLADKKVALTVVQKELINVDRLIDEIKKSVPEDEQ